MQQPTGDTLTTAHAALLGQMDLFAGLDRVALARLAACAEPVPLAAAETVCREGDPPDGLYVVARGTFGIFTTSEPGAGERQVGTFQPGDVVGEMALLTGEPRAATIRAETGGEVVRLGAAALRRAAAGSAQRAYQALS
jgi:NTE family protein